MVAITQALVAGLMTFSAVHALPQAVKPSASVQVYQPSAVPSPSPAPAPDAADKKAEEDKKAAFFTALLTTPTAVKRFKLLLTQGGELLGLDALRKAIVFTFDPKTAPPPGAKGGVAVAANIDTFPVLAGLGISTTLGFLEPCGINTPHVHPRSSEFLTLVEGDNLKIGFVLENGLVDTGKNPEISATLKKFDGTVFPQGSIHFQFNDNCDKAVFVAALNSEDPGTNQVAQGFFALNDQVVNATLGFPKEINGSNIKDFRNQIPANLAQDVEVCLARCNKKNN